MVIIGFVREYKTSLIWQATRHAELVTTTHHASRIYTL